jgi:micrococcal nuclease
LPPPLPPLLPPLFALIAAFAAAAVIPAAAAPAPPPRTLQGVVTQVIDGDTVLVAQPGQAPITVRLKDIDAPEICQAWGEDARRALQTLALNKQAELRLAGRDTYGRTVATIVVDGTSVGMRMVEDGHAWSVRFRDDRGPLVKQERMAKGLGRGLHAAGGAVMPRDFRRQTGGCKPAATQK